MLRRRGGSEKSCIPSLSRYPIATPTLVHSSTVTGSRRQLLQLLYQERFTDLLQQVTRTLTDDRTLFRRSYSGPTSTRNSHSKNAHNNMARLLLVLLTLARASAGASAQRMRKGMSHDKPPTAEAEGPLYASAPQLVLLGLPKAGTTSVFSCLTSGAFRNPAPCCANNEKEPQFFRYNLGKLKELQLKNGTYMRRPGVLLLDFSTIYLAEAFWSEFRVQSLFEPNTANRPRKPYKPLLASNCFLVDPEALSGLRFGRCQESVALRAVPARPNGARAV